MKTIFFGTSNISARFLQALAETEGVAAVISQPDKPKGRGQAVIPTETKTIALQKGIQLLQPIKFDEKVKEAVEAIKPEVGIVVSYGRLIPKEIFSIPFFGCFNIHFSILPCYRGAAPIQRALMNGEQKTGVSAFWLEETLDSGPVILSTETSILPEDDAFTLEEKLTVSGIELMFDVLEKLKNKNCAAKKQEGKPTFAPVLRREEAFINWNNDAQNIINLVRGTKRWPVAHTVFDTGALKDRGIKILKVGNSVSKTGSFPGTITSFVENRGFEVACKAGAVLVEEIIPQDKKRMSAWSFIQGGHLAVGDRFK